MQTITFEDKGQDFYEWIVRDGIVVDCQPFQSNIWVGMEVRIDGDTVFIRKGDEAVSLNYKVESCVPTDVAYVDGFNDSKNGHKNADRYANERQYKFGYNVGENFKKKFPNGL
ncbi:hypothetical protein OCF84_21590 (plasmid) [Shewanella xiamenensis]|uniref:Uncharacterized protein n=1 Tax=Shewanella xiamenensis TaxID=332186 RepID=A0ABT6UDJ0_9GAMM|nr:hypothetical protein [Shewanella xiamenensis]MDI5832528.1 hypothetical protein [Shewanella xiamenensis]WHF57853.1 hypothetical protein OCF84_21590 [Shewanella xiamenensis]